MVTVSRRAGFRLEIYPLDHEPPHVHVVGAGGFARVKLLADGRVELWDAFGLSHGEIRKAVAAARQDHAALLEAWRWYHG